MTSTTTRGKRGAAEPASEPPLLSLARQVRGWADTLLSVAGSAADMGMTLAQARIKDPAGRPPQPTRVRSFASGARPPG
jgi:hypothetical protein